MLEQPSIRRSTISNTTSSPRKQVEGCIPSERIFFFSCPYISVYIYFFFSTEKYFFFAFGKEKENINAKFGPAKLKIKDKKVS